MRTLCLFALFSVLSVSVSFAGEAAVDEAPAAPAMAIEEPFELGNALRFNAGSAWSGEVLLGGQPSQADLERLRELGYRTVVNLRSQPEVDSLGWDEAAQVEALGLAYVAIPMTGEDLTEANARALGAVLSEADSYPVLVHCASGNRVGGLLSLKAHFVDGLAAEAALNLGLESGLRSLRPKVEEVLGTQD